MQSDGLDEDPRAISMAYSSQMWTVECAEPISTRLEFEKRRLLYRRVT